MRGGRCKQRRTASVRMVRPAVEALLLTAGELHCVELVEHPPARGGAACRCGAAIQWGDEGEAVRCGACGLHHFRTKTEG